MVTLRQAAQQALEALERADKISGHANNRKAIAVLRQAIEAEQLAEPVAWPRDAEQVRAFMGTHVATLRYARDDHQPDDDDTYTLSAHDFLTAIEWWTDAPYVNTQPARQPMTDEQKLMCWSRATHDADVYHKTQHQCLMDYGAEIEAAHGIK